VSAIAALSTTTIMINRLSGAFFTDNFVCMNDLLLQKCFSI